MLFFSASLSLRIHPRKIRLNRVRRARVGNEPSPKGTMIYIRTQNSRKKVASLGCARWGFGVYSWLCCTWIPARCPVENGHRVVTVSKGSYCGYLWYWCPSGHNLWWISCSISDLLLEGGASRFLRGRWKARPAPSTGPQGVGRAALWPFRGAPFFAGTRAASPSLMRPRACLGDCGHVCGPMPLDRRCGAVRDVALLLTSARADGGLVRAA